MEKKLEATTDKLQEIHKSVSKRITSIEEKTVDGKLVIIKEENNNLQSQRPELVRIVSEGTERKRLTSHFKPLQ